MNATEQAASAEASSSNLAALSRLAIGYATCFDSALAMTAQRMNKTIKGSRTRARLGMDRAGDRSYTLAMDLYIEVHGLPRVEARKLAEITRRVCPYADAVRNDVPVRLHVTVA